MWIGYLLYPIHISAAGVMVDVSPEAIWLVERIGNRSICRRQIGLFSCRGRRTCAMLYTCPYWGGRLTLSVSEGEIEVGGNREDREKIKIIR